MYREQPDIHFKHEMMVLLETENMDQAITWSTDQRFNLLMQDQVRIPSVKVRSSVFMMLQLYLTYFPPYLQSIETDWNRDGIKDYLDLELKMPLSNDENVYGIKLLLFFDVKLKLFSQLGMEAMAYIGCV